MAVAASLPELWRTRENLGFVEGFDLSPANVLLGAVGVGEAGHQRHLPVLPYTIWQCGGAYRELSKRTELLEFEFLTPMSSGEGEVILECPAQPAAAASDSNHVIHAVIFWMEYGLCDKGAADDDSRGKGESDTQLWISDHPDRVGVPKPSHQGVMLLQQPVMLSAGGKRLRLRSSFNVHDGDMEFGFFDETDI